MGTTTCQPMDASGGLPTYSAQNERQGFAALMGGGSGRQLGARSGLRVGTPGDVIAVTSTTWTAQKEFAAILDPASSTTQGPYRYAYTPLPSADSGSVTPADSTYPRKDIIVIRVDDASAGDSSGARQAPLVYRAGAATSMTPVAPTLNAREFLVGTITMPQVGGGSPTFTLNPQFFVSAGAKLPIYSVADRAALTPHLGMEIQRMDLTQVNASGILERWNGATWDHFGNAEWTTVSNGLLASTTYSVGAPTPVAGRTTDSSFVAIVANGGIQARDAGSYLVDVVQKWSAGAVGRAFISIEDAAGGSPNIPFGRVNFSAGEDTTSLSVSLSLAAGQIIYPKIYQSTGTVNVSGVVRVKRLP
ncbi:hypothetical protein [Arthrobacter sp. NA-172]|uniref:hypothetical protein n=1 Tax=Arthrobacter sp. NA-172 TaxID=3367524 RepID=UPI0037550F26